MSLPVGIVAPYLHVLAGVEVGSPLAIVVDPLAVGEQGPSLAVRVWKLAEGQVVDKGGGQVVRVEGTAGEIDYPGARYRVLHTHRTGRVRSGCRNAAAGRAGAHGNSGEGVAAHLTGHGKGRFSSHAAVDAAVLQGYGPFHHGNVLATLLPDRLPQVFLGLPARGGHEGLVVIKGQDIQDDLGNRGVGGPQKRLRITGAVLEFKPDERGTLHIVQGAGDLRGKSGGKSQGRGHGRAELQEVAAGYPLLLPYRLFVLLLHVDKYPAISSSISCHDLLE